MSQFKVELTNRRGPPRVAPDPAYPTGKDVDVSDGRHGPTCKADLPYPAEERGVWMVECLACGLRIAVTAAGRPDDPKSVRMTCKREGTIQ